jgi:hypothetical protein
MLKRIDRIETKEFIYYEAIFAWGSIFAFSIIDLVKELNLMGLKYSIN